MNDAAIQPYSSAILSQIDDIIQTSYQRSPFSRQNGMDETAVYLNCSPDRKVHVKGEKTMSVIIGEASSMHSTWAVTVSID